MSGGNSRKSRNKIVSSAGRRPWTTRELEVLRKFRTEGVDVIHELLRDPETGEYPHSRGAIRIAASRQGISLRVRPGEVCPACGAHLVREGTVAARHGLCVACWNRRLTEAMREQAAIERGRADYDAAKKMARRGGPGGLAARARRLCPTYGKPVEAGRACPRCSRPGDQGARGRPRGGEPLEALLRERGVQARPRARALPRGREVRRVRGEDGGQARRQVGHEEGRRRRPPREAAQRRRWERGREPRPAVLALPQPRRRREEEVEVRALELNCTSKLGRLK